MDAAVKPAKEVQSAPTPAPPAPDPAEKFGWLPCQVVLEIPTAGFTVGDLLKLSKGSIVRTATASTADVPLRVNGVQIGQVQFEVKNERLAFRIMELA